MSSLGVSDLRKSFCKNGSGKSGIDLNKEGLLSPNVTLQLVSCLGDDSPRCFSLGSSARDFTRTINLLRDGTHKFSPNTEAKLGEYIDGLGARHTKKIEERIVRLLESAFSSSAKKAS